MIMITLFKDFVCLSSIVVGWSDVDMSFYCSPLVGRGHVLLLQSVGRTGTCPSIVVGWSNGDMSIHCSRLVGRGHDRLLQSVGRTLVCQNCLTEGREVTLPSLHQSTCSLQTNYHDCPGPILCDQNTDGKSKRLLRSQKNPYMKVIIVVERRATS